MPAAVVQKACEGLETRAWGLRPINQPILHRIGSLIWQADGIAGAPPKSANRGTLELPIQWIEA